jgi:hypothetical protein
MSSTPIIRAWRAGELIAGLVWFHTRDDDKDFDTDVIVRVRDKFGNIAATMTGQFGTFPDHSVKGPFRLRIRRNVMRAEIVDGTVQIIIVPVGNDTWRFNFDMKLIFALADDIFLPMEGIDLDEDRREITFDIFSSE